MTLRVTILGSGSSGGVPRVGGEWGACDPDEPKNRRRRCSILLQSGADAEPLTVLVDTSPDLREQLLDAKVRRLDAVLFTHDHADHTHGMDDLRPLVIANRNRIDAWMDERTASGIKARFGYIFETPAGSDYPPLLNERRFVHREPAAIAGRAGQEITVVPYRLTHGAGEALGLRVGNFGYAPDLSGIPKESQALFEKLDLLVIDALRQRRHPSHFSLDETLSAIERFKPRQAVLTNMHTDLDYATLVSKLPIGVIPAFDGMVLTL